MIPDELIKDLEILKAQGCVYEIVEEVGKIYIIFKDHPLPVGLYNLEKTDLLIFTTPYYPNAGFDMFWVDQNLILQSTGRPPKAGEVLEPHLGKTWRRFSYHPYQNRAWNPSEDSVITFMMYVAQRLQKGD